MFKQIIILLFLSLMISCSTSNSNNMSSTNTSTTEPIEFMSSVPSSTPTSGSLTTIVTNIVKSIPKENSNDFIEPSLGQRGVFSSVLADIFRNDLSKISTSLKSINYDLSIIKDKDTQIVYYVLSEKSNSFKGLGTYIISTNYTRNVIIEVPHPISDSRTDEEGVKILKAIGARGLFIAGTHRCANRTFSTSFGKTKACNGFEEQFRTSDAGHFPNNFFQEAHKVTLTLSTIPLVISLHGNNDDIPEILLSDGTEVKSSSTSIVNKLKSQLRTNVGSCNLSSEPNYNLCGTTNIQGTVSNNAANPYAGKAKTSTGLFLHIEQHLNVRSNPTRLINALKIVIPERR